MLHYSKIPSRHVFMAEIDEKDASQNLANLKVNNATGQSDELVYSFRRSTYFNKKKILHWGKL